MQADNVLIGNAPAIAPSAAQWRVERRTCPDARAFRDDYVRPRRPVVLTDAAEAWPIRRKPMPDYFNTIHGEHRVRVLGQECRLADLVARLEESSAEKPGPYPCKYEIARAFRDLLPEVAPRPPLSLPDRQRRALVPQRLFDGVNNLEIFFGGPGGRFPYLHYDVLHLHAWITQLYGDKEFTLYAPGQEAFLYVNPDLPWQSTIRNHHSPDYARYPLLRNARPHKLVLRRGETLFLPCGWWHTARSLTFTISIAFDQLGPDNWNDFRADLVAERRRAGKPLRALALGAYLHAIAPLLALGERFGGGRARDWGSR